MKLKLPNKVFFILIAVGVMIGADFTNSGVTLTIDEGVTITADGSFDNQADTLYVYGTLNITGDLSNSGVIVTGSNSAIIFNGIYQSIAGGSYSNVAISGYGSKTLQGNVTLNGTLDLNSSSLDLNSYTLTVTGAINYNGGSFTGSGDVILNGTDVYDQSSSTAYSGPVWYVDTTGSASNNGSAASPFVSIQTAIDSSSSSDTVLVQAGTYSENINFNGKSIKVVGEDQATTIIDGSADEIDLSGLLNGGFESYYQGNNEWQLLPHAWLTWESNNSGPSDCCYAISFNGESVYNSDSIYYTYEGAAMLKMWGSGGEWNVYQENINFIFEDDGYFNELKKLEMMTSRIEMLDTISSGEMIGRYYSVEWVRKNVLMQTEEDMEVLDKQMEDEKAEKQAKTGEDGKPGESPDLY